MKSTLYLIVILWSSIFSAQQKFSFDKYGYVNDPLFKTFIKKQGYDIVGNFVPVNNDSILYYARVVKDNKWGFIDAYGKEAVRPKYDYAIDFIGGSAQVYTEKRVSGEDKDYKLIYNFIDSSGNTLGEYDFVSRLNKGFYVVNLNGKSGIINTKGEFIVPLEYSDAYVAERYFYIAKNDRFAVFDYTGKQLTDFLYTQSRDNCKVLRGFDGKKFCVLDKITAQPINDDWYYDNYLYVTEDGKMMSLQNDQGFCLINDQGKKISDYYMGGTVCQVNTISIVKESGAGLYNSLGQEVIPCIYKDIHISEDGQMFTAYKKDGHIDYFNKDYKLVDFSTYQVVEKINNGFVVRVNNKVGFADYDGKLVIPAIYNYCDLGFDKKGIASVNLNQKSGLIDRTGKALTPFINAHIIQGTSKFYKLRLDNGLTTLCSEDGVMVPVEYDDISFIRGSDGFFSVKKGDKWGMVDKNNKFVIPCTYTYLNDKLNDNGLIAVISGNKMG